MYGLYAFFSIHWFAPIMHSAIACFLYLTSEVFQILVYCIQGGQCCWHCKRSYWSWKSVLLIIHKDTFFFYHIFAVNYRITVTQIKVVFSQSISVTNQCPRWKITTNRSCTPYQISELLRTLLLVKNHWFIVLHRLTPTYIIGCHEECKEKTNLDHCV